MSVAEIKKTKSDLIAWIEQLSDSKMLNFLESLRIAKSNNDWWDDLSESQKKHINEEFLQKNVKCVVSLLYALTEQYVLLQPMCQLKQLC